MDETSDRWTFLRCLREDGITLELVGGNRFRSTPSNLDPAIKSWIMEHRAAIVAELRETQND